MVEAYLRLILASFLFFCFGCSLVWYSQAETPSGRVLIGLAAFINAVGSGQAIYLALRAFARRDHDD